MKTCFKCGEAKPLRDFYPHKRMADGHLNKCKECTLKDVHTRYRTKPELCAEYERRRFQSAARKERLLAYQLVARERNPEKYRAHMMTSNAIRSGRLVRQPCEICGTTARVEAHHDDYFKPLDVRWLCFRHHREIGHGQRIISSIP